MQKVIITDGFNMIGAALIKTLVDKGIFVTLLISSELDYVKNTESIYMQNIKVIKCDLSNLLLLENDLDTEYDAFFYLGWSLLEKNGNLIPIIFDQTDLIKASISSIKLAAAIKCPVFVGASYCNEYDSIKYMKRNTEDDSISINSITEYNEVKLCENLCEENNIRFCWTHFFNVYGLYDNVNSFIMYCLKNAIIGESLILTDYRHKFSYINSDDCALALYLTALNGSHGDIFDFSGDETHSVEEYAEIISNCIDCKTPIKLDKTSLPILQIRTVATGSSFLEAKLGFKSNVSFDEGIKKMFEWAKPFLNSCSDKLRHEGIKLFMTDCDAALVSLTKSLLYGGERKNETLDELDRLFYLPNQSVFRETFERNVKYLREHKIIDNDIPLPDEYKIYYSGKFIKIYKTDDGTVKDFHMEPKQFTVGYTYAGIIIECDNDFIQILDYLSDHHKDIDIYVVANRDIAAYMALLNLTEINLKINKIFSSIHELYEYFKANEIKYFPKSVISGDSFFQKEIDSIMLDINSYRKEHKRTCSNILLSICIPSYDRGKRALENVNHILNLKLDSEIEIIVSNNGSIKGSEYYDEIEKLEDSRIVYNRNSENKGFRGNIIKVLALSRGKFSFIISDEDHLDLKNLYYFLQKLHDNPEVAVLKTSSNVRYRYKDSLFTKGQDALLRFDFNNYISGTVYNISFYKQLRLEEKLINYCKKEASSYNIFVEIYPHLALDMFYSACGDIIIDSKSGFSEGLVDSSGGGLADISKQSDTSLPVWYQTGEVRVKMFIGRMNLIYDILPQVKDMTKQSKIDLAVLLFRNACFRTFFLISLSEQRYAYNNLDINKCYELLASTAKSQFGVYLFKCSKIIGISLDKQTNKNLYQSFSNFVEKAKSKYM